MTIPFIPEQSALLVMDFQRQIISRYFSEDAANAILNKTATLIAAARAAKVKVMYVVVGFREGYPEISSRNKVFSAIKANGLFAAGCPDNEIHEAVAPLADEPVITKHRISALQGTDLDMILKSQGITTLIMSGLTTSGVVLSTTRQAFDLDYNLLIAEDCCADGKEEVHRFLLDNILSQHAEVLGADELIKRMESSAN